MKCSQKAKAIYDRGSLLIISRVDYGEAENLMGRDQLRLDRLREESAGIVGVAQWPCLTLDYIVKQPFCLFAFSFPCDLTVTLTDISVLWEYAQ